MSRKLLFWKNKQVKLPQIELVSTIITKSINQRVLPDFLSLVQLIRKAQRHRLRKSQTRSPITTMEQETTSQAKKRPHDDTQLNEVSLYKKSKKNHNNGTNSKMEVDDPEALTSTLLNDFFAKFQEIIRIIVDNYKYSSNRILLYFHEILKIYLDNMFRPSQYNFEWYQKMLNILFQSLPEGSVILKSLDYFFENHFVYPLYSCINFCVAIAEKFDYIPFAERKQDYLNNLQENIKDINLFTQIANKLQLFDNEETQSSLEKQLLLLSEIKETLMQQNFKPLDSPKQQTILTFGEVLVTALPEYSLKLQELSDIVKAITLPIMSQVAVRVSNPVAVEKVKPKKLSQSHSLDQMDRFSASNDSKPNLAIVKLTESPLKLVDPMNPVAVKPLNLSPSITAPSPIPGINELIDDIRSLAKSGTADPNLLDQKIDRLENLLNEGYSATHGSFAKIFQGEPSMEDHVRRVSQKATPVNPPTTNGSPKKAVSVNVSGKTLENAISRVLQGENLTNQSNEFKALKQLFTRPESQHIASEDLLNIAQEFNISGDKMVRLVQQVLKTLSSGSAIPISKQLLLNIHNVAKLMSENSSDPTLQSRLKKATWEVFQKQSDMNALEEIAILNNVTKELLLECCTRVHLEVAESNQTAEGDAPKSPQKMKSPSVQSSAPKANTTGNGNNSSNSNNNNAPSVQSASTVKLSATSEPPQKTVPPPVPATAPVAAKTVPASNPVPIPVAPSAPSPSPTAAKNIPAPAPAPAPAPVPPAPVQSQSTTNDNDDEGNNNATDPNHLIIILRQENFPPGHEDPFFEKKFRLGRNRQLKKMMKKYCEATHQDFRNLDLEYKGKILQNYLSQTPGDYQMENEDVVWVRVKNGAVVDLT